MDNVIIDDMSDSANVSLDIIIPNTDMLYSAGAFNEFIKKETTDDSSYQSALKCFNNFCTNEQTFLNATCKDDLTLGHNNASNIKDLSDISASSQNEESKTDNNFDATDDESMAVEALRQLGGMYDENITTEQIFSSLPSTAPDTKIQTTCDNQMLQLSACPLCRKKFDNEQEVHQHNCSIQEKLLCNICNTSFFSKNDLQKHVSFNHQSNGIYRCTICNTNFHRPSSLTNHLKIHNYQPGRSLDTSMISKQAERIVDSSLETIWSVEQSLMSDVTDNSVTSDALSSWNFNYNTVSQIIQNEVNQDVSSLDQDISTSYAPDSTSSTLDDVTKSLDECRTGSDQFQIQDVYENSVKAETLSYTSEKMDETFPILSLPQLEIIIKNDEIKPHVCTDCGLSFARSKALISHKKLHAINWSDTYECNVCGEMFSSKELKEQHNKSCFIKETLLLTSSSEQEKEIPEEDRLDDKILKKPQVKVGKHACPDCDKRFATKQKMYRHMWIHRKKIFTCELCAMTFKVQLDLDKHRLSQHPADSPYVCQECGKSFASRQGLWEHGRVHGGGPAGLFRCTECGKTFTSRQGYLIHNRTHTGEKPYGCRFCLKAFRDGGTLRKHERIHTGERPHVCPICLHDFNQKVVLREHVRWVHAANKTGNEEGMFVCQLCSVSVTDREELCAHIVKHSDLMAAEAKDSNSVAVTARAGTRDSVKTLKKTRSTINSSSKVQNILPSVSNKDISDTVLIDTDFDINSFDFSPDLNCYECDMCGNKFSSQKELTVHVQLHS